LATGIITDNYKATGVCFRKRNDRGSSISEASADEIIVNSAMPNIVDLLPEHYRSVLKNELEQQKTGASLLTVYLGFSKPLRELGNRHYSTFVYDNSVKTQRDILKNNRSDFASRSYTFVDYSQVDSQLAPAGKSVGAICCIDYLEDWENLDRSAYNSKKEQVALTFIERLEKLIPGIGNIIEYYEVGTPYTLKRYTLNPGGAVYGFAQNPLRKPIHTSSLPGNIHFASARGKTGGVFSGAIYSGYLCAINILRKNR
jgi:phytoene dehydrogenase-like protein